MKTKDFNAIKSGTILKFKDEHIWVFVYLLQEEGLKALRYNSRRKEWEVVYVENFNTLQFYEVVSNVAYEIGNSTNTSCPVIKDFIELWRIVNWLEGSQNQAEGNEK